MKLGLIVVCILVFNVTFGAESKEKAHAPLLAGMGNLHHPINTKSRLAQRYYNQGLTLAFAFNHKEAIRSFTAATRHDPNSAMAYWGIAYANGPHVNKAMTPEETASAWRAIQRASELAKGGNAKEAAYINALSTRYEPEYKEDRTDLDKAYAKAMRKLAAQYPDDLDAQVLFAEAMMDTMPWDYWTKDFTPRAETAEVLTALKSVLRRNPDHPGANHLYIHAVEAGPNPEHAIPSADRLGNFAPNAGHLVHMPSHIYMRVGEYAKAAEANREAVRADQSYIKSCRAQGFYPGVYYPHNIHFLWWSELFQARGKASYAAARKAADYAVDNYCGPKKAEEAPRLRHLPWLTLVRFGYWDDVLKVKQPHATNDFLVDRIIWHYTRGIALLGKGQIAQAENELRVIKQLARSETAKELDQPFFPAKGIFGIAENHLAGKIAAATGKEKEADSHFKKAIEAEDSMPYMEPTFWPIPVRPSYGAALLAAGAAAKAEAIFREDLAKWPRNPWGLYGLRQALLTQNKHAAANLVEGELKDALKNADTQIRLNAL